MIGRGGTQASVRREILLRRILDQAKADAEREISDYLTALTGEIERLAASWRWERAYDRFWDALALVEAEYAIAAQQGKSYPGTPALTRRALAGYIEGGFSRSTNMYGNELTGAVTVQDREAARISETEISPWDMKESLLNGKNSKVGASGRRYNTIMFRHQTPGTAGMHGAPMPADVYAKAKGMDKFEYALGGVAEGFKKEKGRLWQLSPMAARSMTKRGSTLTPEGTIDAEGKLHKFRKPPASMRGVGFHHFKVDAEGDVYGREFEAHFYEHKTNIYSGMRRMTQFYKQQAQQFYATFRRVSEQWTDEHGRTHGSDADSWWHNGLPENPISAAVLAASEKLVMAQVYKGVEEDLKEIIAEAERNVSRSSPA